MTGHIAKDCKQPRTESKGRQVARAKQVGTKLADKPNVPLGVGVTDPRELLQSSSDEEAVVSMIQVTDTGSRPRCVKVELQGVPVYGLVDSGADISIIGGSLFRRVATVARLKKRNFKTADRTPRTYDQRPFRLDGRMDLDIHFEGKTMRSRWMPMTNFSYPKVCADNLA